MSKLPNVLRIPFKDPEIKAIWDNFYLGLQSYEYTKKKTDEIADQRIKKLVSEGMPEGQAIDEAIDSVYDIDHEELKKRKAKVMESVEIPF